jgi:hypothetical protein
VTVTVVVPPPVVRVEVTVVTDPGRVEVSVTVDVIVLVPPPVVKVEVTVSVESIIGVSTLHGSKLRGKHSQTVLVPAGTVEVTVE